MGPSREYYSYEGYVEPGFEYQVGSECFDPALGRCKTSGEIQSEYFASHPPHSDVSEDEPAPGFDLDDFPDEVDGAIHDGNGCYMDPDTGDLVGCA